ncbi:hypothetical protein K2173_012938 [Erythroxylum novogranatense]|uniref:Uncharacterized protein n=1 Tax=Erythroxylum novogranatense TaxID=1862640 RepID=A0AAV8S5B8_9ROSI|nr:hypothetical protein K2173_012938 [Erythroxylum novogranatense]
MAMLPEDVGSWLPSEFLTTVEDSFVDKENFNRNGSNSEFKPSLNFPTEFPYEFDPFGSSSALSSPVESVVGSAESGDDDNGDGDFLSGLTRRLTQQLAVKPEKSKWVMAGSPKSTLSGIGSWSVSSNGSPKAGISPPTTPFELKTDPCDLIYEAAGQVARLKMSSEGQICQERHVLSRINQYRNQDQVPRPQFWVREQVKGGFQDQQLHLQEQIQNRARLVGYENGKGVRPFLLPQSAWPPPQVQLNHTNSGARQLTINGPGGGVKREKSTGTGVFYLVDMAIHRIARRNKVVQRFCYQLRLFRL